MGYDFFEINDIIINIEQCFTWFVTDVSNENLDTTIYHQVCYYLLVDMIT